MPDRPPGRKALGHDPGTVTPRRGIVNEKRGPAQGKCPVVRQITFMSLRAKRSNLSCDRLRLLRRCAARNDMPEAAPHKPGPRGEQARLVRTPNVVPRIRAGPRQRSCRERLALESRAECPRHARRGPRALPGGVHSACGWLNDSWHATGNSIRTEGGVGQDTSYPLPWPTPLTLSLRLARRWRSDQSSIRLVRQSATQNLSGWRSVGATSPDATFSKSITSGA